MAKDKFNKLKSLMGPMESSPINKMSPEKIAALTGVQHPVNKQNEEMLMRIQQKIAELEEIGDEESLAFWRQKAAELQGME